MATATSNSVALPPINGSNGSLNDEFINGLVQGGSWLFSGPRTLTYSFNLNDDGAGGPGPGGAWTTPLTQAVQQALAAWSNVANINFQQITSGTYYYQSSADLAFTLTGNDLQNQVGALGLGVFPAPDFADTLFEQAEYPNAEGDVFLDNSHSVFELLGEGGTGLAIILHEIGHALGLKHTFDDGGNAKPTFDSLGIGGYDSHQYSIMSDSLYSVPFSVHCFPSTPMPLDILAIQHIYGANTSYKTGNDTYVFENDGKVRTFWDAGGVDTFDFSGLFTDNLIDLREGGYSHFGTILHVYGNLGAAVAYGTVIENAISGSGQDTIYGNSADNQLSGGADKDLIFGFIGTDTLLGGSSNDTIDGGHGFDLMSGGSGHDFYHVDSSQDVVEEVAEYGLDTVWSSASFELGPHLEDLRLVGDAAINGSGNNNSNYITGNGKSNRLSGHGGRDVLEGGAGDDIYVIDENDYFPQTYFALDGDPGDYITQGQSFYGHAGNGTLNTYAVDTDDDDLVDFVSMIYTSNALEGGFEWNLLFTTGAMDQELQEGTYNNVARYPDEVTGQAGMNIYLNSRMNPSLTGTFTVIKANYDYSGPNPQLLEFEVVFEQHSSGAVPGLTGRVVINGSSTMAADTVFEASNEGNDKVVSGVNFVLPDHVESLVLTGSSDLSGHGNAINNILSGNAGGNFLDGGSGADIIAGGAGNDVYVIDHSGDQVLELGSSGNDSIQSAVSYDLMQSWHVEHLTLTGGGTINGSGNWMDNVLTGNVAANRLDGGRGNDTLDGGGGSDTLIGSLGDDVLIWDAADVSIDGGAGFDRLQLNGGGLSLNLATIADNLISGIEAIDLTGSGNNTLTLALGDVLAISSTDEVLRVDGNEGDAVNAGGGWVSSGNQVHGAQTYAAYTQLTATLLIDTDVLLSF